MWQSDFWLLFITKVTRLKRAKNNNGEENPNYMDACLRRYDEIMSTLPQGNSKKEKPSDRDHNLQEHAHAHAPALQPSLDESILPSHQNAKSLRLKDGYH